MQIKNACAIVLSYNLFKVTPDCGALCNLHIDGSNKGTQFNSSTKLFKGATQ